MSSNSKKIFLIAIIVILLAVVTGTTLAYFFADLKGTKINEINLSSSNVTYTEPEIATVSSMENEIYGIKSDEYVEFSVSATSTGTNKILYTPYIEEVEGNTINVSNVRIYLTDEFDVPIKGYGEKKLRLLSNEISMDFGTCYSGEDLSYDYVTISNISVNNLKEEVSNLPSFEPLIKKDTFEENLTNEIINYFGKNYLNLSTKDIFYIKENNVCKKYQLDSSTVEVVDNLLCDYELSNNNEQLDIDYASNIFTEYQIKNSSNEGIKISLNDISMNEHCLSIIKTSDGTVTKEIIYSYDDVLKTIAKTIKKNNNNLENIYILENNNYYKNINEIDTDLSICKKYEFIEVDDYITLNNGTVVDNGECYENGYYNLTKVDVYSRVLSDEILSNNSYFSDINNKLISNNEFKFVDGLSIKTDKAKETHNYRLRFWADQELITGFKDTSNIVLTPIDADGVHTVVFGIAGSFKFKINVYAIQE